MKDLLNIDPGGPEAMLLYPLWKQGKIQLDQQPLPHCDQPIATPIPAAGWLFLSAVVAGILITRRTKK